MVSRRIEKFAELMQSVWLSRNDYERRVKLVIVSISTFYMILTTHFQLLDAMSSKVLEWACATFDGTYQNAKAESSALATYKTTEKRTCVTERQDLITLYSNVQTKLKTYGLRPWVPTPELSPQVCT